MNPRILPILIMLAAGTATSSAKTADVMTEPDFMAVLADRFGGQRVKTYDDEESWTKERKETFKGSFELETPLAWNPKVKVIYRIPMTVQKRPTPNADHIVVFCSWPGGAQPPAPPRYGEKAKPSPLLRGMAPFSEGLGFSVFSLEIVTDKNDMGNKREAYFYGGPEWVDVVLRAQEEIIKRHRLKRKKLLLYGASLGGTFAERLAIAMPDKVAGVAIQNAPEVTLPSAKANTAWFVSVTRGDSTKQVNTELVQTLRKLGTHCIDVITPPGYGRRGLDHFYHLVSPEARRAARLFLQGVVERQDVRGENDPTRWPYVCDAAKPLLIRRNEYLTTANIPEAQREYMPSREFVQTLQSMPMPMQTVAMNANDPAQPICMVGVPPPGRPKGIIMFSHRYQYTELPQLLNNLYFLAEQGYVVLAPKMRGGDSATALQNALNFVGRNRPWASLPLSFIGVGAENEALWNLLLTQRSPRPAAHVPIDFDSGDLLDPSKWPVGSRVEWPMLFLYDQKDFEKQETPDDAGHAASRLQQVQSFIESMQRKNQVASVRFVPLGQKTDERSAQKKIEAALQFIDAAVAGNIRTQFR